MTVRFFALLTNIGAAKLANATALGTRLEITQMVVGDGGGTLPTPNPAQTQLVNEQRRAALNMLTIDPVNTSQIIAEQVIPEADGGWWIREIGLLDKDGDLIAIANCAETYKPQLQEGSGRTQTIRVILIVSSTAAVTLKIDPAVVLATRKYVDDQDIIVKAYADNLMKEHLLAADPHPKYALKASPAFTGKPTAPTAAKTENSTQLANTAFVQTAITEIATALAAKMDKAKNGSDIPNVAQFLANLGLGDAAAPGKTMVIVNRGRNANGYWKIYNNGTIEMHGFTSPRADGTADVILPIPLPTAVQIDNVFLTSHFRTNTPTALRGVMVNDSEATTKTTSFGVLALTSTGVDFGQSSFSWRLTYEVL